jgi:hypothetical protein
MKKYFLLLLLFYGSLLKAQAPAIDWQKAYGGNDYERLYKILNTTDGGYVMIGTSYSGFSGDKTSQNFGLLDFWVIKTTSLGGIEWQKNLGGNDDEDLPRIIQTSDGGYLIGGETKSSISGNITEASSSWEDYWVLKLDQFGNIQWQNTLGTGGSDYLRSIIECNDGGYLLAGSSVGPISSDKSENNVGEVYGVPFVNMRDYWVVKIDNIGNKIWDNTIGSKMIDAIAFTLNGTNGGYLAGGYSNGVVSADFNAASYGDYDCWLVKLDEQGNIIWQKTIGGSLLEDPTSAIVTSDGGYLIGMSSKSNISGNKTENCKGDQDYWVVKIDALGNIQWDKTLGGNGGEYLRSLSEDTSHNFYVGGFSDSTISGDKTQNSKGGYDFWIVKVDNSGNVLWDKTIGGTENEVDSDMQYLAADDSIIIGGTSLSSNSGDKTEVTRGLSDYWLIKLQSDSLVTTSFNATTVSAYPNPTTKTIQLTFPKKYNKLEITVINILGQKVQEEYFRNLSEIGFDLVAEKGVYFVEVRNENKEKVIFKVVKE